MKKILSILFLIVTCLGAHAFIFGGIGNTTLALDSLHADNTDNASGTNVSLTGKFVAENPFPQNGDCLDINVNIQTGNAIQVNGLEFTTPFTVDPDGNCTANTFIGFGASSFDNGAIGTDGSGDITANGFFGNIAPQYVTNAAGFWAAAPSGGGGGGAPSANYVGWFLATNAIVFTNGIPVTFSASTSSGMNEALASAPLSVSNGPSGQELHLGPGTYTFTSPILLTNNMKIVGAGYWGTRLLYTGPTNIFSLQQVMTNVSEFGFNQKTLHTVGLIQLSRPAGAYTNSLSGNQSWQNFYFSDFCIQVATNFPCVMIAGYANNFYEDRIGCFGPDVLSTNQGGVGSAIGPVLPGNKLQVMATIGQAVDCFQIWDIHGSLFQELAAGILNVGNSFFTVDSCGLLNICHANATDQYTNAYPQTNWLCMGPAIFSCQATYTTSLQNNFPYLNALDMWFEQSGNVSVYEPQGGHCNIAVGGAVPQGFINFDSGSSTIPIEDAVDVQNGVYYLTNLQSWYAENPDNNDAGIATHSFGEDTISGALWEQQYNGKYVYGWTAGDPQEQIAGLTNGFYIDGGCPLHANGAGLTNIPPSAVTNAAGFWAAAPSTGGGGSGTLNTNFAAWTLDGSGTQTNGYTDSGSAVLGMTNFTTLFLNGFTGWAVDGCITNTFAGKFKVEYTFNLVDYLSYNPVYFAAIYTNGVKCGLSSQTAGNNANSMSWSLRYNPLSQCGQVLSLPAGTKIQLEINDSQAGPFNVYAGTFSINQVQ